MSNATGANKSWARLTIERVAVALMFGALVNAALDPGLVRRFPLLADIQAQGAALGLRLATAWNDRLSPLLGQRASVALPPGTRRITILDVDEAGCSAIVGYVKCRFDRIGHAQVAREVLAAADAAKPDVIVYDLLLPTQQEALTDKDAAALLETLKEPGPPIFAPIAYGENPDGDISINWANSICGAPRCGRLRLAPAFAFDGREGARAYPTVVHAHSVNALSTAREGIAEINVGSLPFMAVSIAGAAPESVRPPVHLLYTIPSFATAPSAAARQTLGSAYWSSVEYFRVSDLRPIGATTNLPVRSGHILLVGSSAPASNDLHRTPLGEMTGMEVLANALRTIELRSQPSPKAAPPRPAKWLSELRGWVVVAIAIGAITFIDGRRKARLRTHGDPRPPLLDRYSFYAMGVLSVAFAVELAFKLGDILAELDGPMTRAGDVDIIFPMLAIFFTTAVEFSHRIMRRLEQLVGILLDAPKALRRRRGPPANTP